MKKSEFVGIRITSELKVCLEVIAKEKGFSLSRVIGEMLYDCLEVGAKRSEAKVINIEVRVF